jgi:hypothetical protein
VELYQPKLEVKDIVVVSNPALLATAQLVI